MKKGLSNIVSKSDLSQSLEVIVKDELERLDKVKSVSVFSSNDILSCPRKLHYRSIKVSKDDTGIEGFNHKCAVRKWRELLNYYVVGEDMVLADCNYNIVSLGAIMIEIDHVKILLEVQSVSNDDFESILLNGAHKKDVVKLMVNEWLAEVERGLLIYENRNDFRFEIFQVHPYSPIIKSIKTRCEDLMKCNSTGALPDRPYKDSNMKECNSCAYSIECWAN